MKSKISRFLTTLVALLAVTTGAWATTVTWVTTDFYGTSPDTFTKDDVTVTTTNGARSSCFFYASGVNTFTTTLGNFTKIEIVFWPESSPVNISGWDYELIEAVQPDPVEMPDIWEYKSKLTWTGDAESVSIQGAVYYIESITFTIVEPSSGPEVAWDKAKNSGTFKMPGGNVTLEPEYYPQAVLATQPTAIDNVPATTDGAIVEAGTVANIGETTTAQGTVMYYVSQTALDDAALQALAADQWTADVPTAAGLAQGPAYVYYYVRGNDSDTDAEIFSDGDILATNALTVTIAAEPTYAVTFAEGVNPEPPAEPEWTASPAADVKKGQTVTVTYTGSKKVIGVKAEKKSAAAPKDAKDATAEDLGKVIGADGNIYDDAGAATAANTTAVAMIAYVGSETGVDGYTHGLAIALADEGEMNWSTAKSTCEGKAAVSGAEWLLPSQDQWKAMFKANGGSDAKYTGLNTAITNAGGTALQEFGTYYWSSTEGGGAYAYCVYLEDGGVDWTLDNKGLGSLVRACLAF